MYTLMSLFTSRDESLTMVFGTSYYIFNIIWARPVTGLANNRGTSLFHAHLLIQADAIAVLVVVFCVGTSDSSYYKVRQEKDR
jgi:hypothetical protein